MSAFHTPPASRPPTNGSAMMVHALIEGNGDERGTNEYNLLTKPK